MLFLCEKTKDQGEEHPCMGVVDWSDKWVVSPSIMVGEK